MWKVPPCRLTLDTPAPRGEGKSPRGQRQAETVGTPPGHASSAAYIGRLDPSRERFFTRSTPAGHCRRSHVHACRKSRSRDPRGTRAHVGAARAAQAGRRPVEQHALLGRRPVEQGGRPAPDGPVGAAPEVALRQQHHVALGPLHDHRVLQHAVAAEQLHRRPGHPDARPGQRHHPDRRRDAVGLVEQVRAPVLDEQRRVDHAGARQGAVGLRHVVAGGRGLRVRRADQRSSADRHEAAQRRAGAGDPDAAAVLADPAHRGGEVEQPPAVDAGDVGGPHVAVRVRPGGEPDEPAPGGPPRAARPVRDGPRDEAAGGEPDVPRSQHRHRRVGEVAGEDGTRPVRRGGRGRGGGRGARRSQAEPRTDARARRRATRTAGGRSTGRSKHAPDERPDWRPHWPARYRAGTMWSGSHTPATAPSRRRSR